MIGCFKKPMNRMSWELKNPYILIIYANQEWHGDNEQSTEKYDTQDSQFLQNSLFCDTCLKEDLLG